MAKISAPHWLCHMQRPYLALAAESTCRHAKHAQHGSAESWACSWCADAFGMLRTAHGLRDSGLLPKHTGLWAVENPLINSPARLKQKIDAGAEVILTQPPLLWPVFEQWMEGVARANLAAQTQLVIGVPMLTSASSLRFWLALCGASNLPGAASLLDKFDGHDSESRDAQKAFYQHWTAELISKVTALPGVAGLHIMPVTAAGRAQALQLIEHNQLGSEGSAEKSRGADRNL